VFELSFDYLLGMALWLLALPVACWLLLRSRRAARRRGRSLRPYNLGLSVWMLLVGLTAVELYFAVVYDQSDSLNMTNVSQKWFRRWVRQKPLKFAGREGIPYRDDVDFPTHLEPGQRHVVFIGDSFTFGHGIRHVPDRFSNRVRERLQQQAPGQILVTNIADAGKDLHWVSEVTDRLIENHLPVTTLVYVLCLNDIETFDPRHRDQAPTNKVRRPPNALLNDTYFFNLLYFRSQQATVPGVRDYYSHVEESYRGIAWKRMFGKLMALSQECRDAGMDFRVVVFPFLHNLGPEYPFREAHGLIVEACRREHIPCLDLLPMLEPHARERLTVNIFDAHPNERAHNLAAEAISAQLLGDLVDGASSPPSAPAETP
jgi:hypothetical protein